MVILASEDIGNADPQALVVANAAAPGGRPGTPAGVPAQPRVRQPSTLPWPRSPTPPIAASSGPPPTSASMARSRRPRTFRTPTTREPASSGGASATSTFTTSPDGVAKQPRAAGRPARPSASTNRPSEGSRRSFGGVSSRFDAVSATPRRESAPAAETRPPRRAVPQLFTARACSDPRPEQATTFAPSRQPDRVHASATTRVRRGKYGGPATGSRGRRLGPPELRSRTRRS